MEISEIRAISNITCDFLKTHKDVRVNEILDFIDRLIDRFCKNGNGRPKTSNLAAIVVGRKEFKKSGVRILFEDEKK